jgi:hypothetical protein
MVGALLEKESIETVPTDWQRSPPTRMVVPVRSRRKPSA